MIGGNPYTGRHDVDTFFQEYRLVILVNRLVTPHRLYWMTTRYVFDCAFAYHTFDPLCDRFGSV